MSPQNSNQFNEMDELMTKLRQNPNLQIKDAGISFGLRLLLQVTGFENRPFTSDELAVISKQHQYHLAYFNR